MQPLTWASLPHRAPVLFQSSSSQKAGCNRPTPVVTTAVLGAINVSILIQPEGRMQLDIHVRPATALVV